MPRKKPITSSIQKFLQEEEGKPLVRMLACGSVDDGKSTLIGRLFYDTQMIAEDTLRTLIRDSRKHGTTGGDFDPALFTDGLKAEREQGITIDVAYRYFSSNARRFIVADTPGHEQYTRNMATGASTADLAIVLVDARKGVLEQTKRHSTIIALLGIRHVILAVNKMDLVGYDEAVFSAIRDDYTAFTTKLEITDLQFVPMVALHGDNIARPSAHMPWYSGGSLLHLLNSIHVASDRNHIDFRFPVQYVLRRSSSYRGYCGTVASGVVRVGDEVVVLPSRKRSRIRSIDTYDGSLPEAFVPMAVTLILEDDIDVSRGDMIAPVGNIPRIEDSFDAMIVWLAEEPLTTGKQYLFRQTTRTIDGSIPEIRYAFDVNSLHRRRVKELPLNAIGRCSVRLAQPIAFDSYARNRAIGSFIVIDRMTNATVGAGMIVDRKSAQDEEQEKIALAEGKKKLEAEIRAILVDASISEEERVRRIVGLMS